MKTPICDFVDNYAKSNALRFHMPGHKGKSFLGFEENDITEINGADSLYEADGIIKDSEDNAGKIFGCPTFYSTEGSSQCIRAMMFLISQYARSRGIRPLVLAGRNAHKTFISVAAMIDFDIEWIYPQSDESYLSCKINATKLDEILNNMPQKPVAVYLTNPDYLGNCIDIGAISDVCKKHNVILAVDNAHGAYLKFLSPSEHPIDKGADICCDSAHKTLPVLTGGAYLHISDNAPEMFTNQAKNALEMFGSTSPSYIIMQSLDAVNPYLSDGYAKNTEIIINKISEIKNELVDYGYDFIGDEPLKLTFNIKKYGYSGFEFADVLAKKNIICEFCDPDYIVLMISPQTGKDDLDYLKNILLSVPCKNPVTVSLPVFMKCKKALSVREAVFSDNERIPVSESVGRILSVSDVGCPPAVPIVISGEIIDSHAVECFEYYGIKECTVVK